MSDQLDEEEPDWHRRVRVRMAQTQVKEFLEMVGLDDQDAKGIGREVREMLISHRRWKKAQQIFWTSALGAATIAAVEFFRKKFGG